MTENEPTRQAAEAGADEDGARLAAEDADRPVASATDPARSAAEDSPRERSPLRWWLLGAVCAVGLGIFMWAVGGRWNVNAPRPGGPAATPQEAVQKYMAAVDNHDKTLAESYTTGPAREHLSTQMGTIGYLRFVSADVGATVGEETAMRVTFDEATSFLNDEDPVGLNLAALVWTERETGLFNAVRAPDGSGWLVSSAFGSGP